MFPTLGNLDITKTKGTTTPVTADSLPGILPSIPKDALDMDKYRVKYLKLDMNDPGDIIELEMVETRAIRNQGIFLLSKEKFIFMDKMFILISYLVSEDEPRSPRLNLPPLPENIPGPDLNTLPPF
jgi:hypothetical protein